jgi:hypothetical protein
VVDFAAIRPAQASRPVSERARAAEGPARASEADGTAPQDRVTISSEARTRAQGAGGQDAKDGKVSADGKQKKDGKLTAEQQRQVAWLQQRDTHVRQHEAAHQAAGGSLTGGASFSYQFGPDGRGYAVGGEVPVRLATGRTPEETISNARQARRAALAPADPSAADLAVANSASQMEQAAQAKRAQMASQAYGKQTKKPGEKDEAQQASGASYQGSLQASDDSSGPAGATLVAA